LALSGANLFKKDLTLKDIRTGIVETLSKCDRSFATVKWWKAEFKRYRKNPENELRRPVTVATQEIVNKVHDILQ
jgi:hypothetical protein